MASTREIRRRIRSIKSTAQITKALQLVSAAKMRKAQDAATAGKAYADTLQQVLLAISQKTDAGKHPLMQARDDGETAVVLFTSDRGQAGSLNTNILREAEKLQQQATYVTVGKKGRDYVVKTQKTLVADFKSPERADYLLSKTLANMVIDDFTNGKINKAVVVYTQFINTLRQTPVVMQLLPITAEALQHQASGSENQGGEFLYEPSADTLLDSLLHHFLEMTMYQAQLEALASEHSARMIAMKNATDNANELVDDLTLTYNQARQSSITKELLEITSAAAAMNT